MTDRTRQNALEVFENNLLKFCRTGITYKPKAKEWLTDCLICFSVDHCKMQCAFSSVQLQLTYKWVWVEHLTNGLSESWFSTSRLRQQHVITLSCHWLLTVQTKWVSAVMSILFTNQFNWHRCPESLIIWSITMVSVSLLGVITDKKPMENKSKS